MFDAKRGELRNEFLCLLVVGQDCNAAGYECLFLYQALEKAGNLMRVDLHDKLAGMGFNPAAVLQGQHTGFISATASPRNGPRVCAGCDDRRRYYGPADFSTSWSHSPPSPAALQSTITILICGC